MDLPTNPAEPPCLHVDLNGAFATIEQQANRLLRGKAIGVAANPNRRGTIISPSYEAKEFGIKTGDRVFEAMERYPRIQILHADPDKYFSSTSSSRAASPTTHPTSPPCRSTRR
jgi:nucleotidyltransferase/DNA polymerase involved in DNA repair